MINKLKELINFQSYSGQEKGVLEYIKTDLEKAKMEPFFQDCNLIVKLTGKNQNRAFIFNGHVDIVDIGDPSGWKYDPWAAEVIDGRIYGRGTSDMKGGILAMMETAKLLLKRGTPPTDIWFTFVAQEETDGSGTRQFVEWFQSKGYSSQYKELSSVFAEPTGLNVVQYGHRGSFFIKAEKKGESGHSSRPNAIKPHAIVEISNFILDLEEENLRWQEKFKKSEFAYPTITPTSIQGKSESPNRTAENCVAILDLRTIPNYHQEAFSRVKELADKRAIQLSLLYPPSPVGYTNPLAKIVKIFQQVVPKVKTEILNASTDLGFFTQAGIEGVIFGPGDMNEAHRVNESADISQITKAPGIYEKVYLAWAEKVV